MLVFDTLVRRPRTALVVMLVLTIAVGLGILRLRIDFSPEQVYAGQDDAVAFCEQHKQMFRFEDSLLLVVLESTDGQDLLQEDRLQWLQTFAEQAAKLPGVREVTSLVTLQTPQVATASESGIDFRPWLQRSQFANRDYLLRRVERMPLLNDTLISHDRRMLLTLVDLHPDERSIRRATAQVRSMNRLLSRLSPPPGTNTFLSGVPAIRVDVIDSIVTDQKHMVPVCSLLFLVVSLLMFRSWKVTLLSVFSALATVALTLGLMGWLGVTFSVMSNAIPALLLIIAAANNVHILSRFQIELRRSDSDVRTCAVHTMREMSQTCFLTLVTTAIGFGSLLIARADLLQSLAIQAASGMACCYVSLMIIMPPTLVLCARAFDRTGAADVRNSDATISGRTGWRRCAACLVRREKLIITAHVAVAGLAIWSARNVPINSYMFETYDGDHPTMVAVRKLDEKMSGLVSLEVQLQADDAADLLQPDVAVALEKFRARRADDSRITFYRDYLQFLSTFDRGRLLTEDPTQVEDSLRRIRFVLRHLQQEDFGVVSTFLSEEPPAARVMMRLRDIGSAGMRQLIDEIEADLSELLPAGVTFRATGDAYLHAHCMDAFVRDLFYSLLAATFVIFVLITLLFRSLRIGLIAAVPNLFPLVITLGYLHLRGYELTAGNTVVFAISLGIAVDDTIHFLARYRDERQNHDAPTAIAATLHSSGRAIVLTSVLVVSGLSVLVFSDFVPTRRFAELTAVTMCAALPGDVILLPTLLYAFGARQGKPTARRTTGTDSRPRGTDSRPHSDGRPH